MRILLALLLILLPINSYAFTAGKTLTRTLGVTNTTATSGSGNAGFFIQ